MKENFRVSRPNLVLLLLLTVGIFLYAFAGSWLTVRRVTEAEAEGARLEDKLRVQELLHPAHSRLLEHLSEGEPAESLRLPEAVALSREQLKNLQGLFQIPVRRAGLELKEVLPDSDGYNPNTQFLSISLVVEGRLADFHNFLVTLGNLAFVERFFSLEILSHGETRTLRVHLQIRVQQGEGLS